MCIHEKRYEYVGGSCAQVEGGVDVQHGKQLRVLVRFLGLSEVSLHPFFLRPCPLSIRQCPFLRSFFCSVLCSVLSEDHFIFLLSVLACLHEQPV